MSYPLALEVKDMKSPPTQVIEEVTGRVRAVSPTPRHDPLTGTAAFSPLGVYADSGDAGIPQGIPLISIPEQSAKGTGICLV